MIDPLILHVLSGLTSNVRTVYLFQSISTYVYYISGPILVFIWSLKSHHYCKKGNNVSLQRYCLAKWLFVVICKEFSNKTQPFCIKQYFLGTFNSAVIKLYQFSVYKQSNLYSKSLFKVLLYLKHGILVLVLNHTALVLVQCFSINVSLRRTTTSMCLAQKSS